MEILLERLSWVNRVFWVLLQIFGKFQSFGYSLGHLRSLYTYENLGHMESIGYSGDLKYFFFLHFKKTLGDFDDSFVWCSVSIWVSEKFRPFSKIVPLWHRSFKPVSCPLLWAVKHESEIKYSLIHYFFSLIIFLM